MMQTHDILNDPDVEHVQWYDSQEAVFTVMAGLQRSGWWVSEHGLMTSTSSGSLVARPLKLKGQNQYTGVGIWRFNPVNEA